MSYMDYLDKGQIL